MRFVFVLDDHRIFGTGHSFPNQSSHPMSMPPSFPQQALPPAKSSGTKWVFWGCGGCLGLMLLGGIVMGVIFFGVMSVIKNTDAYKSAITATTSPEVQAELGTPITPGIFPMGSVNMNNGQGTADLSIPITGPKGAGTIHYKATSNGGSWKVSEFNVVISSDGKVIDLKK
jgi:hypothetical protein